MHPELPNPFVFVLTKQIGDGEEVLGIFSTFDGARIVKCCRRSRNNNVIHSSWYCI